MVSNRIKQVLPQACLEHVISMKGLECYRPDKLTSVIDAFVSSHVNPRGLTAGIKSPKPNFDQNKTMQSKPVLKSPTSISSTTGSAGQPPIRCFSCRQVGHRASECNVNITSTPKSSYPAGKRTGGKATGSPIGKAKVNHAKVIVDKVEDQSRAAIVMRV